MGKVARHHPGALQIGVDDMVPIVFGVLEQRLRHDDPGIVDEDRQRPEPIFGRGDRRGDAVSFGDVAGDGQAGPAARFDLAGQLGEAVGPARGERHLGAGGGENFGEMAADAARRAGDERDLPGDVEAGQIDHLLAAFQEIVGFARNDTANR